jgi:hypothetical protein
MLLCLQLTGDVVVNLINLCFAGLALGFGSAKSYVPRTRAILKSVWHEALPMLLYSQVSSSVKQYCQLQCRKYALQMVALNVHQGLVSSSTCDTLDA